MEVNTALLTATSFGATAVTLRAIVVSLAGRTIELTLSVGGFNFALRIGAAPLPGEIAKG